MFRRTNFVIRGDSKSRSNDKRPVSGSNRINSRTSKYEIIQNYSLSLVQSKKYRPVNNNEDQHREAGSFYNLSKRNDYKFDC